MAVHKPSTLRKVTMHFEYESGRVQTRTYYCDENTTGIIQADSLTAEDDWAVKLELKHVKVTAPETVPGTDCADA